MQTNQNKVIGLVNQIKDPSVSFHTNWVSNLLNLSGNGKLKIQVQKRKKKNVTIIRKSIENEGAVQLHQFEDIVTSLYFDINYSFIGSNKLSTL